MILYFADERGIQGQIRGDLVLSAIVRSDLTPIPCTLEVRIKVGEEGIEKQLAEGKLIATANGDLFRVVKSTKIRSQLSQGDRDFSSLKIIALLDACHPISFVSQRGILKENATLSAIYRASGAKMKAVLSDFPVPRFYCYAGQTPSFQIARVLQEEGGVVRWKHSKLQFLRLLDIFRQKSATEISYTAMEKIESGFTERHDIPSFFSLNDQGSVVFGNKKKARFATFIPHKNAQQLQNMTRCLVTKGSAKTSFSSHIAAGDLIDVLGDAPLAVVTAAHCFENTPEAGAKSYTKLWLASMEA